MTDKLILDHLEKMDKDLYKAVWDPDTAGMMVAVAQSLAMVFMLVVVARIAFDTILRHKPLDLSQLIKPVLITFVLANWFLVASAIFEVVRPVETFFKDAYAERIDDIDRLRDEREALVQQFHRRLTDVRADQEVTSMVSQSSRQPDEETENEKVKSPWEDNIFSEFFDKMFSMDWLVAEWMVNDAAFSDGLQNILFWIGEVFWELSVYFTFLVRYIAMAVLVIFGPLYMAASILPAFEDGWRKWTGRAVTVSFFGPVAYFVMSFMMVIIEYAIRADIGMLTDNMATQDAFMTYLKYTNGNLIGTSGLYCVALFVGCGALAMVPEFVSWVWPGDTFRSAAAFVKGMNESARDTAVLVATAVTAGVGALAGAAAGAGAAGSGAAGSGGAAGQGAAAGAGGPMGSGPGPDGLGGVSGGVGTAPFMPDGSFDAPASGASPSGPAGAAGSPVGGAADGSGSGMPGGGVSGGTPTAAEAEEAERARAAELENLVQLRRKLELYDQAVHEGRAQEFMDRFFPQGGGAAQGGAAADIPHRPEIAALEDRFLNTRSDSAAREALIDELDRRIAEFEARGGFGDGTSGPQGTADEEHLILEQAQSLKERMARLEQAEAEGRGFEFRLSELESALALSEAGFHKRPGLAALEARYLRAQGNPQARRELLEALDGLIARYEGRDRDGDTDGSADASDPQSQPQPKP